ncbi:hypothetical protein VTL71DRAFT_715 [Oculimacula yallundae]|uniref:Uncharacterized protein n=1 Tax=Oculimacula yallundae TaxID=86028 RepID=A0ABR4D0V1_9HELO
MVAGPNPRLRVLSRPGLAAISGVYGWRSCGWYFPSVVHNRRPLGSLISCVNYASLNYSCHNVYEDPSWPEPFLLFLFTLMPRNLHDDIFYQDHAWLAQRSFFSVYFLFDFFWRSFSGRRRRYGEGRSGREIQIWQSMEGSEIIRFFASINKIALGVEKRVK